MDFATPLCIAREREGSTEEEEGSDRGEEKGERKEERRKKTEREEEWEGRGGANAEKREVAGKLSVDGSLEKRSSRTI